jgi:hypothetical protein
VAAEGTNRENANIGREDLSKPKTEAVGAQEASSGNPLLLLESQLPPATTTGIT